jgi:6,7-dimethyl-8-ribityllumazine synthase
MATSNQSLSSKRMVNVSNVDHFRISIVVAEWNNQVTGPLYQGCLKTLLENGVKNENISIKHVPGSWELISGARKALDTQQPDAVICIGCVIKGDTPHFEYICQGVTNGLAQLCAIQSVPVIYGVLTVFNLEQALERAGGVHGNKGDEAAYTALRMIV